MAEASTENMTRRGYTLVRRPTDPEGVWLHNDSPVWIVHYPATEGRAEFWQAYRAVAKVPAGRKPWTVDNRRTGAERGLPTLEAAADACEAFIASQVAA